MSRGEGIDLLRTRTDKSKLTSGVHLFIAPYMGRFMPCSADRESVEWRENEILAARNSRPSL